MNPKAPPGPPSKFFGLNQIALFQPNRLMQTFEMCARTYGDVVRVSFGGYSQTMVFHPDDVHRILIDESEKVGRSKLQQRLFSVFLGNSLTNSDGEFWKRQRKLMQPAFHARCIQGYIETMAEHTARYFDRWQFGDTYDMDAEMIELTLSNVTRTLFGADVTATADQILSAVYTTQEYTMRKAPAMLSLPIWVPLPYHRRTQRDITYLREVVMDFIEKGRAEGKDRGDLLSMLLLAVDEDGEDGGGQMTDLQARDEAISMLIVGHTTTSALLSWALYEVSRHPEVEAKLLDELDTILGGRTPSMENIRQLKYMDMVIKETLRLYPPSWGMPRDVVEDIVLGDYLIPKGTGVLFCQQVMHRDPRWFPESDRFMPERFADGWEEKVPKCAYMPFGYGSHICIGQTFAISESLLILAMLLQRFRLTLVPGQEIVTSPLVSQRPRYGLRMQVEHRQPKPVQAKGSWLLLSAEPALHESETGEQDSR